MKSELYGKDLISIGDVNKSQILQILNVSAFMEKGLGRKHNPALKLLGGQILATLFSEPSTRTRLSFEAAMFNLHGKVMSTPEASKTSSAVKGETLADTGRILSSYANVIAVRHPVSGSARQLADGASVPVINGGDGNGEHPTQAMLDLFTIIREREKLKNLKITMVGDLINGRTAHSLMLALIPWKARITLVSPAELRMPAEIISEVRASGLNITETDSLEEGCKEAEVVYMTRLQAERFKDSSVYERLKNQYVIDAAFMEEHPKTTIMHPLPRLGEITPDVDSFPNAAYFRQAQNGLYTRMAILALILRENIDA